MNSTTHLRNVTNIPAAYTREAVSTQQQPLTTPGAARSTVLITRLARAMRRQFEQAVAPLGLRARHLVALTHLKDHGPSPQQTLIETLGLDASNLVALLNELEDADLIVRRRDRADRRRGIIELSAEGHRVLAEVDRALEAVDDEVLSALSPDERVTLNELLARAGACGPLECDQEAAEVCEAAEDECEPPAC
jgi:DNA-binding MarR family transcriptional regulator